MFFDVYKALCAEKKMTPNGVAKEIGVASPSVTQWKHGSTPRPAVLQRIADYFGVSVDYLLTGETKLDIMLERILSLIPKKENGDFKHGAKKEFAIGIGFKSGEIVSDWIAGRSKSYEGYLYQIAALHNVSVEWLRGETDDPNPVGQKEKPPALGGELSLLDQKLNELLLAASDDTKRLMIELLKRMQSH